MKLFFTILTRIYCMETSGTNILVYWHFLERKKTVYTAFFCQFNDLNSKRYSQIVTLFTSRRNQFDQMNKKKSKSSCARSEYISFIITLCKKSCTCAEKEEMFSDSLLLAVIKHHLKIIYWKTIGSDYTFSGHIYHHQSNFDKQATTTNKLIHIMTLKKIIMYLKCLNSN